MAGELIGTRPPAVERLRGILSPTKNIEEASIVTKTLGRNASIHAEFYASRISCRINKNLETIMEFGIGPNGLEHLWFGKVTIAILLEGGGSTYPIRLRQGTHVAAEYTPSGSGFTVDEKDEEMFRGLGDYLVDWVEASIKKKSFLALPVQLCSRLIP